MEYIERTKIMPQRITMRDRAIIALQCLPPYDGPLPHFDHTFGPLMELARCPFQSLTKEVGATKLDEFDVSRLGRPPVYDLSEGYRGLHDKEWDRALRNDAELFVELAERFDWCSVPIYRGTFYDSGPHTADEIALTRYVKELAGDRLLVETTIGFATLHLPSGNDLSQLVYDMYDHKEEFKERLNRQCEIAIERGKRLIDVGVDVVDEVADYCYNSGCWLSPNMFREFVFPYLYKAATALKQAGAYFVCHTDGDVMGILDQLIEAEIDALHSIQHVGRTSMAAVKAAAGNRICLIGNVDMDVLIRGPKEAVVDATKTAIFEGAPGGAFILATSNGMTLDVPLENCLAMERTWQQYGRYPLPAGNTLQK